MVGHNNTLQCRVTMEIHTCADTQLTVQQGYTNNMCSIRWQAGHCATYLSNVFTIRDIMTFKVCGENTGKEIVIWFKRFPPEKKKKIHTAVLVSPFRCNFEPTSVDQVWHLNQGVTPPPPFTSFRPIALLPLLIWTLATKWTDDIPDSAFAAVF